MTVPRKHYSLILPAEDRNIISGRIQCFVKRFAYEDELAIEALNSSLRELKYDIEKVSHCSID